MVEGKHQWKAWLYLAPAIILLLLFTVWPICNTLRMAFWEDYTLMKELSIDEKIKAVEDQLSKERGETVELTKDQKRYISNQTLPKKIGFKNFKKVIEYDGFKQCLLNTLLLTVLTVPISTILALLIAVCLNSIKPLQRVLQTIFFLPYVTNSIAIGMVFEAMFNIVGYGTSSPSYGIINSIIGVFGIDPVHWINGEVTYWSNITVLVIYIVWNALPFKILVLLGGLQSVNKQYYEAAKVDATPRWRVFTRITVPLLSPMIAYVVITSFIGGFKEYSSIVGIFGEDMKAVGGPSLNTMVGYIYDALGSQEGRASAAALILFAIIFVVTMINLRVSKKKTHY